MSEVWKDIPGYEGHYQVSDGGSVRSLDRLQTSYGGRHWLRRGRPMKLTKIKDKGYMVVTLTVGKLRKRPYVHELVLLAFVGPRSPGMQGCHSDGNPSHNKPDNLRWDTPSGNCLDKHLHGTMPVGDRHHKAVNSAAVIAQAKQLLKNMPVQEVARLTGVSAGTLHQVKSGRQWFHV